MKYLNIFEKENLITIFRSLTNANAKVNGKSIKPDISAFIYKGSKDQTLLPVRFTAEALGFEVSWAR